MSPPAGHRLLPSSAAMSHFVQLLLLLCLVVLGAAFPTMPTCGGPALGHGAAHSGDGGYTLKAEPRVKGSPVVLRLSGGSPFRGFLVKPTSGGATLSVAPGQALTQSVCGGVGHSSPASKESVTMHAALPASGEATLTFWVLTANREWYGPLSAKLTEAV